MYGALCDFEVNFGMDGIFGMDRARGDGDFVGDVLLNE
jgi:hypothetical protein